MKGGARLRKRRGRTEGSGKQKKKKEEKEKSNTGRGRKPHKWERQWKQKVFQARRNGTGRKNEYIVASQCLNVPPPLNARHFNVNVRGKSFQILRVFRETCQYIDAASHWSGYRDRFQFTNSVSIFLSLSFLSFIAFRLSFVVCYALPPFHNLLGNIKSRASDLNIFGVSGKHVSRCLIARKVRLSAFQGEDWKITRRREKKWKERENVRG